jgi:hypothetical protein
MASGSVLQNLAKRYLWWDERGGHARRRVIVQVMDLGTFDDIVALLDEVGKEALVDTIANAKPGWFHPSSWSYWHYRLGLVLPGETVPAAPRRDLSAK